MTDLTHSSLGSRECPTCFSEFASGDHRVRILQCGHSQCTNCIRAQFFNGRITCASCRAIHTYTSIDSIPINYIAEKMKEDIDRLKNQVAMLVDNEAVPLEPKLNKGICKEYGAYKLFWCNEHHVWICSHCSITDHPKGYCEIIPIRKQFENEKVLTKSKIYEELKLLKNTMNEAKHSIDGVNKQTEEEKNNVKKMKYEIETFRKIISDIEKEVSVLNAKNSKLYAIKQDCDKKKSELEKVLTSFHNVSTFNELDAEKIKCVSLINEYENWRKGLEEDKDLSPPFWSISPSSILDLCNTRYNNQCHFIIWTCKIVLSQNMKNYERCTFDLYSLFINIRQQDSVCGRYCHKRNMMLVLTEENSPYE
ncbi:unnamed protein product, partial [Meganyctiphanes norvegica]